MLAPRLELLNQWDPNGGAFIVSRYLNCKNMQPPPHTFSFPYFLFASGTNSPESEWEEKLQSLTRNVNYVPILKDFAWILIFTLRLFAMLICSLLVLGLRNDFAAATLMWSADSQKFKTYYPHYRNKLILYSSCNFYKKRSKAFKRKRN